MQPFSAEDQATPLSLPYTSENNVIYAEKTVTETLEHH